MYVPPNKSMPGLKARTAALREQAIKRANAEAQAKVVASLAKPVDIARTPECSE